MRAYNVLDMGALPVPDDANGARKKIQFLPYKVTEVGFFYVYLSYEGDGTNWVYFDDLKVTHTQTNIVQYNEYYAFGLQTPKSWTRDNATGNNYLYNQGAELNTTTGIYDLFFRNYDPVTGRFFQVDPKAALDPFRSSYVYAGNSPVVMNDPLGDIKSYYFADQKDPNAPDNTHLLIYSGYGSFGSYGRGNAFRGGAYNRTSMSAYMGGLMTEARGMEWNFNTMLRGDFERYYGVDLSTSEGKAEVAKSMGTTVYENGVLIERYWQLVEWEGGYHLSFNEEAAFDDNSAQQGWWFDDQGEVLFDHWRNGKGKELFLDDPEFWGDYMKAHDGLTNAIEYELANKIGTKEGLFKGVMKYDFGGGYQTGYQLLGGSNARVGGLSYSGELTVSGDALHYNVRLTWNDIMDPTDSWDDKFGNWLFPGTPYTVHISWTYNFTLYKLDK